MEIPILLFINKGEYQKLNSYIQVAVILTDNQLSFLLKATNIALKE